MKQITTAQITELLNGHEAPCVSLYQPTHRRHPESQENSIRYKNLLKEMEKSLEQKYPPTVVGPLMEKFQSIAHDEGFWKHRTDGLAILATPKMFQLFELQQTMPELLVVADSFHLKPLLRITQASDRYQILCLDRNKAKLYRGNRDALDPVELTGVPTTITEALGEELTEPHETVASYGKGPHNSGSPMHHGHGGKKDEVDIDMTRFFRAIDHGIVERYSKPTGLPLILASLHEYHTPFREVCNYPHLMNEGITKNPESLNADQLRAEAWRIMEPHFQERMAKGVDEYQKAKAHNLGTDDLAEAATAAIAGRVGTLLLEADRQIPGHIDVQTGDVEYGTLSDPKTDDALDDLAELVLRTHGQVMIVPAEQMPTTTGLAAGYRY